MQHLLNVKYCTSFYFIWFFSSVIFFATDIQNCAFEKILLTVSTKWALQDSQRWFFFWWDYFSGLEWTALWIKMETEWGCIRLCESKASSFPLWPSSLSAKPLPPPQPSPHPPIHIYGSQFISGPLRLFLKTEMLYNRKFSSFLWSQIKIFLLCMFAVKQRALAINTTVLQVRNSSETSHRGPKGPEETWLANPSTTQSSQ